MEDLKYNEYNQKEKNHISLSFLCSIDVWHDGEF